MRVRICTGLRVSRLHNSPALYVCLPVFSFHHCAVCAISQTRHEGAAQLPSAHPPSPSPADIAQQRHICTTITHTYIYARTHTHAQVYQHTNIAHHRYTFLTHVCTHPTPLPPHMHKPSAQSRASWPPLWSSSPGGAPGASSRRSPEDCEHRVIGNYGNL